ncbi:AMP-binding protein [Flexibacterium corallicola]|uniref:AMP-binding protein n=1 Tax=Flexibacterium corallicola TaxID=3037259 RepID=UPI00286F562B|nr:AMP-binding protein [Pseudovibrio sp. M1P-2-3]
MELSNLLPVEVLRKWANEMPDAVYLRQPTANGTRDYTWSQSLDTVARMATALKKLGLPKGSTIGLMGQNTAEWFLADYAAQAVGLVTIPVIDSATPDTIQAVLENSRAQVIFIGKLKAQGAAETIIAQGIMRIGLPGHETQVDHEWDQLVEASEPLSEAEFVVGDLDDLFSVFYTSGSTGKPKGVEITFRNIIYSALITAKIFDSKQGEWFFSYLPLAHVAERSAIQYHSLYSYHSVFFNDNLDGFIDNLRKLAPKVFFSVPRLWMKFQAGLLAKFPQEQLDKVLQDPKSAELFKKQIKMMMGLQNAQIIGSGTAPISRAVLDWYGKLGINISEGWGMTETSGIITAQVPFRADKLGSVGKLLEGFEGRLAENGELLVKGPGVMRGYHRDPDSTAQVLSEDGWLRTGDKARIDEDGYISISGRVTDIFKSSKGKYVAPVPIESLIFENPFVEQACVMGSHLHQPAAVIFLTQEAREKTTKEEISTSFEKMLDSVNERVEGHEKLCAVLLVKDEWSAENGLLTATLKIKRALLEKKYADMINGLGEERVVWEQDTLTEA